MQVGLLLDVSDSSSSSPSFLIEQWAQNLADIVVDFQKEDIIPLSNCHCQSHDNASK